VCAKSLVRRILVEDIAAGSAGVTSQFSRGIVQPVTTSNIPW